MRTALVTGALGGVGTATIAEFARAKWRVFGVDQREGLLPDGCERLFRADLADPAATQGIIKAIGREISQLDALINNAAVQLSKSLLDTTVDEWDEVMGANLRSIFLAVKYGHPLLSVAGGAIVNVSSVHALSTSANIAAYAASKGGVAALTRALAIELAPTIRVNSILPGATDTRMLREGILRGGAASEEAGLAALADKTVLRRIGSAREIARGILFLADHDQSSFMTGQSLVVDGGATCRLSTE